ncbi:MAG TPA: AtpZ/AtpI family protein [Pyrinomonadaceae bacterium]
MIKNLLSDDQPEPGPDPSTSPSETPVDGSLGLFDNAGRLDERSQPPEHVDTILHHEPESAAENMRRSGLAYSAGIAFSAAVIFMLILGWGADVLFGTSPWGIVGGIILGSVIGFVQFFRITSQIFKK